MKVLALLLSIVASPAAAQEPAPEAANPLAVLFEELDRELAAAGVPFSDDQKRAISLMMEDRRRASEDLFGGLMDFRAGPTQGEQGDRLRSAIAWMRGEFMRNVATYITPAQQPAWEKFQAGQAAAGDADSSKEPPSQTQYVRINNNAFTAEDRSFGNSGFTEVIPKGGAGAWHGNAQLLLKDDALNARNPAAFNEPPYQERRISADVSGPAIARRLTTSAQIYSTESKDVTTVQATLPDGVFALGVTRPYTYREIGSRNTLQLSDAHSLTVHAGYGWESARSQGVGGFSLPERASDSDWRNWWTDVQQFSTLSSGLFETHLHVFSSHGETVPLSEAVRINVLDAFNGGGGQNRSQNDRRVWDFNTLFTRLAGSVTVKTGIDGSYRRQSSVTTNNFGGTFTFSSLDAYLAGTPINYRVTEGEPMLETSQLDGAPFVQADINLTSQFTLMLGLRYEVQTNLADYNNVSPRASFGYSPGQSMVIRGGGGLFYTGVDLGMIETQRRFDGTQQYEIVIDNPSYPDPFVSGTIRQTPPSVRVTDPDLTSPYFAIGMLSIERTFFSNLQVSASYNFQREFDRMRTVNLNAPFDPTWPELRACQRGQAAEECVRPYPDRGHIISLEASGREVRHNLRLSARKRFSVFNVSGEYTLQHVRGDVQGAEGAAASDSYDPGSDWGPAPFPMHSVSTTVNARLPLGVFVTGRMDANSGRYYSVTTGEDDNRDGNVTDRPSGFGPNSMHGPKYLDVDFNISKAFFFRGSDTGPNVNVFVNMTNAFNHTHPGIPSGVLTSPNFGLSTSAEDPREIEMGVRFQF